MKVPRGFPLYLFSAPDPSGWVLALGRRLATLDLLPVNDRGGRRVVLVTRRRDGEGGPPALPAGWTGRVIAAPERLPFPDGVAAEIVVTGGDAASLEIRRVLGGAGRVLALHSLRAAAPPSTGPHDEESSRPAAGRRFVLWPIGGGAFLVTRSPAPDPWPFQAVHLGKPGEAVAAAYRRLSKLAPRWIPGRTLLRILPRETGPETPLNLRSREADLSIPLQLRSPGATMSEFGLVVKPGRNAILFDGRGVLKFPLAADMVERTRRGAEAVAEISRRAGPDVRDRLPRVLEADFGAPRPWIRERRLHGRAATRAWWIPGRSRRVTRSALPFLVSLHEESARRRPLTASALQERLRPPLRSLAEACRGSLQWPFPAERLCRALGAALQGREIPLVRGHGDYSARNFLLAATEELTGVVDWDRSRAESWPMLDLLHMLAFRHRRVAIRWFGRLLEWRFLPRRLARWEAELTRRYLAALGLEDDLWEPFVVIYWLELAALRLPLHPPERDRAAWLGRNVIAPLNGMLGALPRST